MFVARVDGDTVFRAACALDGSGVLSVTGDIPADSFDVVQSSGVNYWKLRPFVARILIGTLQPGVTDSLDFLVAVDTETQAEGADGAALTIPMLTRGGLLTLLVLLLTSGLWLRMVRRRVPGFSD